MLAGAKENGSRYVEVKEEVKTCMYIPAKMGARAWQGYGHWHGVL